MHRIKPKLFSSVLTVRIPLPSPFLSSTSSIPLFPGLFWMISGSAEPYENPKNAKDRQRNKFRFYSFPFPSHLMSGSIFGAGLSSNSGGRRRSLRSREWSRTVQRFAAPFIVFQVVIISRNRNAMLLTRQSISNRLANVTDKSTVFVAKNLLNFTAFHTYRYLEDRQLPLNYQQIYNTNTRIINSLFKYVNYNWTLKGSSII